MSELSKIIYDYFKENDLELDQIMTEIDNVKIDLVHDYLEDQNEDSAFVIKRSGSVERFDKDKILRSIKNAADQNNQQLNTSDIEVIFDDIEKHMKNAERKVFRTDEIKEYVKKTLTEEGFSQIYDSYSSYIKI